MHIIFKYRLIFISLLILQSCSLTQEIAAPIEYQVQTNKPNLDSLKDELEQIKRKKINNDVNEISEMNYNNCNANKKLDINNNHSNKKPTNKEHHDEYNNNINKSYSQNKNSNKTLEFNHYIKSNNAKNNLNKNNSKSSNIELENFKSNNDDNNNLDNTLNDDQEQNNNLELESNDDDASSAIETINLELENNNTSSAEKINTTEKTDARLKNNAKNKNNQQSTANESQAQSTANESQSQSIANENQAKSITNESQLQSIANESQNISKQPNEQKGNYIKPIDGDIITKFNQVVDGKTFQGIYVIAKKGEDVVSATSGVVIQVSFNKEYNNIVIINHKGTYWAYGKLKNIIVKKDQVIKAGEKIAELDNYGMLFIAIKLKNNRIVDPELYLKY